MNRILQITLISFFGFLPGMALTTLAEGLENGDFSHGKSHWVGEGKIVWLKPDGSVSETDDSDANDPFQALKPQIASQPKSTPIVEIKLHSVQPGEISQKFRTKAGTAAMDVTVVFKTSPDFNLNDKATYFTKSITWKSGTIYWSGLVFPTVDFCIRLDKNDGYCYKLLMVKPGSDWQTVKCHWDGVGPNLDVILHIIAPPGQGTLLVKSVEVSG